MLSYKYDYIFFQWQCSVYSIQYTSASKYYSVCQANNRVLYNSLLWVVREEGGRMCGPAPSQ